MNTADISHLFLSFPDKESTIALVRVFINALSDVKVDLGNEMPCSSSFNLPLGCNHNIDNYRKKLDGSNISPLGVVLWLESK